MILFFVGLLAFVPTFSSLALTIVVSLVIGSALIGAIALTLLPVFYRLCPFKSPTGWAFFRLWHASTRTLRQWNARLRTATSVAVAFLGRIVDPK